MTQLQKLDWKVVWGTLVEHAKSPDQRSYCIYELQSRKGEKGELVYASTRSWSLLRFQLSWQDLPADMLSDWQYFTSIEEARRSVGNLSNEEKGIEPFEYDRSRYTAEPQKHYCLCCGYKNIEGYNTNFGYTKPPDTYDICEICFWEDDPIGYEHPDEATGPNHVSFKEAQRNFLEFGASEARLLPYVRKPTDADERDPNWKLR
jgi:Cysteine-rich CPCC